MGRRWWAGALALVVGLVVVAFPDPSVCTAYASPAAPPPVAVETPHPAAPRTSEAPAPDLSGAVARAVESAPGVDLGLAVLDLATGAAAGHNADTPFRSASLSKLVVAVDMLTSGEVAQADLQRLRRALSLSDDNAMNALWTLHDGMGAVARVAAQAGLTATRAPDDASQWGDVEMSARDVVTLYRHILTGLPEADRDFVVGALSAAPATAADGFDQAFGLLAPGGDAYSDAYAKQGWMWYLPADFHLHTAGVVAGRYAVTALSIQTGVAEQAAKDRLTGVTANLLAGIVTPPGG